MTKFSLSEAHRIALAAQGFLDPQPERATLRHINRVMERVGVTQVDSTNVLARAHQLLFFSRLGDCDTELFDDIRDQRPWPLTSHEYEVGLTIEEAERRDHWGWNWNSTKLTIEYLFSAGVLAPTEPNTQFERFLTSPNASLQVKHMLDWVLCPTPKHIFSLYDQWQRRWAQQTGRHIFYIGSYLAT